MLALLLPYVVFAGVEVTNETQYGLPIKFTTSNTYPGDISIDGLYIYKDETDYVVSVLYSGGTFKQWKDGGIEKPKTSFFNPPSGEVVAINWSENFDRIYSEEGLIQYTVDKEAFESINMITIFLFDTLYDNDINDEDCNIYFDVTRINFDDVPTQDSLIKAYKVKSNEMPVVLDTVPSNWAKHNIEELEIEALLRKEAFSDFTDGITRARFVYLMVELYESLTDKIIAIDPAIQFTDTEDPYVLKAASIGITSGIGEGVFAPDQILNREQMTTFLIKTLNLADKKLLEPNNSEDFADQEEMSDWAKSFIYIAKAHGIMGGVGDNKFAPKRQATNEQALYIVHNLLKKYDKIEWNQAFDGDRLYLRYNDDLYKINLENDFIVNEDKDWLALSSLEDANQVLNALLLEEKDLKFVTSENPNVKGTLEVPNYEAMAMTVEPTYGGVDRKGQVTTIEFGDFKAEVEYIQKSETYIYKNFDEIRYYDTNGFRRSVALLPLDKITDAYDINYEVTYNDGWDVYIIEVITE